MTNDDVDFESAKPVKMAAEVNPEKTIAFFKGEESNPIQPKELTEEFLERLYENMRDAEHLAKLIEMGKKDVKELCRGMETTQKGKYVVLLKPVKGRKTVNWKKLTKALIGDLKDEDLEKYSEEGEPSVRLEIRKLD
jgi:hypothetical protein